ncbi:MAG: hypothetical protein KDJ38_14635 [Gammaproteobacteria bacterium]|nr:hypothetical protein [Gammaproteobacteria bacterium]
MKNYLLMFAVCTLLSLSACGGGGGGGGGNDGGSNEDNNSSGSNNGSGSSGGSQPDGLNSGGSGSTGTLTPSTTRPGGSGVGSDPGNEGGQSTPTGVDNSEEQFITYYNSETDYGFWGCFTQNTDNTLYMFLWNNDERGNYGGFGINEEDMFEITWKADSSALTLSDDTASATFSNYTFLNAYRWDADFQTGDFKDTVKCGLYDQDGVLVKEGASTITQLISNGQDGNDPELNGWACTSSQYNPYSAIYLDNKQFAIAFNEEDVFSGTWSATEDEKKVLLTFDDESTIEFVNVDFASANKFTLDWNLDPLRPYSCQRVDLDGNPIE